MAAKADVGDVPDKRELRYELGPNEVADPIVLPADGTPVLLLVSARDAAPATAVVLVSRPQIGNFVQSTAVLGGSTPTNGINSAAGTPIVTFPTAVCGSMGAVEVGPDLSVQVRNPQNCLTANYVVTVVS